MLKNDRPSRRDELSLNLQISLHPLEKWVIDFVGPIQPLGKKTGAWYIITTTEYLTKWVEAQPVKGCTRMTIEIFIFEYIFTRFGFPKVLLIDHGTHFLNEMISAMMDEF